MIQPLPPSGARYRQSRRRLLIDMHIPDWDPAFLSRFDPAELAAADPHRRGRGQRSLPNHVGLLLPDHGRPCHRRGAATRVARPWTALRAGG